MTTYVIARTIDGLDWLKNADGGFSRPSGENIIIYPSYETAHDEVTDGNWVVVPSRMYSLDSRPINYTL